MLDRFLALFVKHSQFMYLLIRPLKPLIIPNKKRAEAPNSKNGASNGIRLEPYCIEFAELTIHTVVFSVGLLSLQLQS